MSTGHGAVPGTGSGTGSGTGRPVPRPAPVPATSTEDATAVLAPVGTPVPLSAVARAGTAVGYRTRKAAALAREAWLPVSRFLHAQARPEPETMREHWAHIRSRAWVPEGMTGGTEKVLALAGILHHLIVACPVKAAAKAARFAALKTDEAADRPLRLYGWLLLALAVFLILSGYL